MGRPGEPTAVGWRIRVDHVAGAVDGDVVVVPADGREVVGIVRAAPRPRYDVVGLEAIARPASIDGAAAISLGDDGSDARRDGPGRS